MFQNLEDQLLSAPKRSLTGLTRGFQVWHFFALAAVLVLAFVNYAFHWQWLIPDIANIYSPEILATCGFVTIPQQRAHQMGLLAIACLVLSLSWIKPAARKLHTFSWKYASFFPGAILAFLPLVLCFFYRKQIYSDMIETFHRDRSLILGALVFVVYLSWVSTQSRPFIRGLIAMPFISYTVAMTVPGCFQFINKYTIPGWLFPTVEFHYSVIIGAAGRLAAGLKAFSEVKILYGLGMAFFYSTLEKLFGPLTFGSYIFSIGCFTVLFTLIGSLIFLLYYSKNRILAGFSLLLALPFLQTFNIMTLLFPNQSALRHILFPFGILILTLISKIRPHWRLPFLALSSGLFLLSNFETGIAISGGLITYVFLTSLPNRLQAFKDLIRFLLITATSFFLGLSLFAWFAGNISPLEAVIGFFDSIGSLGSGVIAGLTWNGKLSKVILIPLVIFIHCQIVLFTCTSLARRGFLSPRGAFRGSISTMILVWLAYFVNRPANYYYLWTTLFLYGFFAWDSLESLHIFTSRLLRTQNKDFLRTLRGTLLKHSWELVHLAFTLFILAPTILQLNANEVVTTLKMLGVPDNPKIKITGVYTDEVTAQKLETKISYLTKQKNPNDVYYFSIYSFSIPHMTKLNPHLSVQNPFREVIKKTDYNFLLAELTRKNPPQILFDPQSELEILTEIDFYKRLKKDLLPHYRHARNESDWEIWERRDPTTAPPLLSPSKHDEMRPI